MKISEHLMEKVESQKEKIGQFFFKYTGLTKGPIG
jgi:hypothetical protein